MNDQLAALALVIAELRLQLEGARLTIAERDAQIASLSAVPRSSDEGEAPSP